MPKLSLKVATTSKTVNVFIQDSSSTVGAGLAGLAYNTASLIAYYVLPLANSAAITLATQTVTGAWATGGFVEIDSTHAKGLYRLDLPNAVLASGSFVTVYLGGAANMAPCVLEIELTAVDNQNANSFGLGVLPATAVPGAAGGLAIAGSNAATTFANLTVSGTSALGAVTGTTVTFSGAVAFQSTLAVTGTTTLTGAVSLGSTLGITGAVTLSSTLGVGATTLNALTVTNNALVSGTLTVTGATTFTGNVGMAAGLSITQSSSNASALVITGNGTGHGAIITSGSGATGDGMHVVAASTNGNGLYTLGTGTGQAINGLVTGIAGTITTLDGLATHGDANWATSVWDVPIHTGTAQAGSSTTITLDVGASSTDSYYVGDAIIISGGTGVGQVAQITVYVGSTRVATIPSNWTTNPDNTSTFKIQSAAPAKVFSFSNPALAQIAALTFNNSSVLSAGTAQGGTSTTIQLAAGEPATPGTYIGCNIALLGGTGKGTTAAVTAWNTSTKTATITPAWPVTPDATTTYNVTPNYAYVATYAATMDPAANVLNAVAASYNTANSIGADINNAGGTINTVHTGTAQAGGTATITLDAGASASNSAYVGDTITITGGTGGAQSSRIVSYVGSTKVATVYAAWGVQPDNTSTFSISSAAPVSVYNLTATAMAQFFTLDSGTTFGSAIAGSVVYETATNAGSVKTRAGTAQAGAATTITLDSGASATNNLYSGQVITITGGTGQGQSQSILSYVGSTKVATIAGTWATNPDNTSVFAILPATPPTSIASAVWNYATSLAGAATTALGYILQQLAVFVPGSPITIVNPVDNTGLISIVQGGAYLYASGTSITFAIDGTKTNLTGITVKLGLTDLTGGPGTATLTVTGTVHNAGLSNQTVTFDLTSTQTAALDPNPPSPHPFRPGAYAYSYVLITGAVSSECLILATGSVSVTANSIACS